LVHPLCLGEFRHKVFDLALTAAIANSRVAIITFFVYFEYRAIPVDFMRNTLSITAVCFRRLQLAPACLRTYMWKIQNGRRYEA
jgi:hypothetical protein